MRLLSKLTSAFIAITSTVLLVNAFFRVHREVASFDADRTRSERAVGRALLAAVTVIAHRDGEDGARSLLEAVKASDGPHRIRWVCGTGAGASNEPVVPCSTVLEQAAREPWTSIATPPDGPAQRATYLRMSEPLTGVLEIAESMAAVDEFRNRTVVDTIAALATMAFITTAMAYVLGAFMVGRPTAALVEKARRVGYGDFSSPLTFSGRDEFAFLATEMNAMCNRLVEAHEGVRHANDERLRAAEKLRHADRLSTIGSLASGIAHELGTPLNVIEARASMIASGETAPSETKKYALVIVDATERMTRIIRQLLAYARRRGPEIARADAHAIATQAIEFMAPLAGQHDVTIRVESTASDIAVKVDSIQFQQALTNLIVNAVQASARGTEVLLRVGRERARSPDQMQEVAVVAFSVEDHGHGMEPETARRVFEPFFTTKNVGHGTGLGLAVAEEIVRDHRGWIAVTSAPNAGSRFSIYVPEAEPNP